MRIAYADPPYPGCAHLYADHPDYAGEVDHEELIERMERDYDGWVLHTGAAHLQDVIALCPEGVRVMAWVKGWCSWKPGVSVKYAWEPVLLRNPKQRLKSAHVVRDWLACNVTTGQVVKGAKPDAVCKWIFDAMGLDPDDDLTDLYPGSGAVTRAWDSWRSQLSLLTEGTAA